MKSLPSQALSIRARAVGPVAHTANFLVQRKCACGGAGGASGECSECRKKKSGLQRRAFVHSAATVAPPIVGDVLSSPGQPLGADTRRFMEPRLGHDFSRV